MSIVIVQHIQTSWNKKSRGGANAVWRNSMPEAAKVSMEQITKDTLFVSQLLDYWGTKQLQERTNINPSRPFCAGCVEVDCDDEEIRAKFRYTRGCAGAPDRGWMQKTLRIASNEWGQIVYNGRFVPGWDGDWWYEKHVVNVGLFERVTPSVFTREAPTYRFDASAHLF